MTYRFVRILVFFDLPVETSENRRNYRSFRKHLIKNGFMMLQESVYCRMALNPNNAASIISSVKSKTPSEGLVMILTVTEKQFSKMELITGDFKSDILDNDKRWVII